jgi:hypothetical protein
MIAAFAHVTVQQPLDINWKCNTERYGKSFATAAVDFLNWITGHEHYMAQILKKDLSLGGYLGTLCGLMKQEQQHQVIPLPCLLHV